MKTAVGNHPLIWIAWSIGALVVLRRMTSSVSSQHSPTAAAIQTWAAKSISWEPTAISSIYPYAKQTTSSVVSRKWTVVCRVSGSASVSKRCSVGQLSLSALRGISPAHLTISTAIKAQLLGRTLGWKACLNQRSLKTTWPSRST